ncbi:hypothetical protein D9M69_364300 [compost metagenome]
MPDLPDLGFLEFRDRATQCGQVIGILVLQAAAGHHVFHTEQPKSQRPIGVGLARQAWLTCRFRRAVEILVCRKHHGIVTK